MGLLDFLFRRKKKGQDRLQTLPDFYQAKAWLEEENKRGKSELALDKYCDTAHDIIRGCLDQYVAHFQIVSDGLDGLFDSHEARTAYGIGDGNQTPIERMKHVGMELAQMMDTAASGKESKKRFWASVIYDNKAYAQYLTKLVEAFGSFERTCVSIPGTTELLINPEVQKNLLSMYKINVRNIRMISMIRDVTSGWRRQKPSMSFFRENADLATLVREMLREYLIKTDPMRVQQLMQKNPGMKAHKTYRFWRSAENLRQMWDAQYEGANRQPKPKRPFVDTGGLQQTGPIIMDHERLAWAIKEVFNNSLGATSVMTGSGNRFRAEPIPKHKNMLNPKPVIRFSTKVIFDEQNRNKKMIRLVIADDGIGIPPEHVGHVTKWAYSPRRALYSEGGAAGAAQQAIEIGGKGIGLAFATDIMNEHGGNVSVTSRAGIGTVVNMDMAAEFKW